MGETVFLVHGWSVQETTTYQALHLQLANHGYPLQEIFLGRYVTLEGRGEIKSPAPCTALSKKPSAATGPTPSTSSPTPPAPWWSVTVRAGCHQFVPLEAQAC